MVSVSNMTKQMHEEQRARGAELIERGVVRTWRELGQQFGISPQAAQMRFGRTYGLQLPRRRLVERYMVSVSLDGELQARLEQAREDAELRDSRASRAQIVRDLMAEHLPRKSA